MFSFFKKKKSKAFNTLAENLVEKHYDNIPISPLDPFHHPSKEELKDEVNNILEGFLDKDIKKKS